jgi:hypothetical protein
MAITKNAMLTKGQRQRLAAFRRRQATRRMRSQGRVKLPALSKTVRAQLKYAAGPEFAKIFTKKPATGKTRRVRMENNGMGGTAVTVSRAGTRTSSRVAGANPEFGGLRNVGRYIAPPIGAPKITAATMNNLANILGKMSVKQGY